MKDTGEAHLDLVHFAVTNLPLLIANGLTEEEDSLCQVGELSLAKRLEVQTCEQKAAVQIAFPALVEEDEIEMLVANLCHPHFALFVLMSEEWTTTIMES